MSKTAIPLVPVEPFIIYRTIPSAVLRYQNDKTGSYKPEGFIVNSQIPFTGVAIREELQSTGSVLSINE